MTLVFTSVKFRSTKHRTTPTSPKEMVPFRRLAQKGLHLACHTNNRQKQWCVFTDLHWASTGQMLLRHGKKRGLVLDIRLEISRVGLRCGYHELEAPMAGIIRKGPKFKEAGPLES